MNKNKLLIIHNRNPENSVGVSAIRAPLLENPYKKGLLHIGPWSVEKQKGKINLFCYRLSNCRTFMCKETLPDTLLFSLIKYSCDNLEYYQRFFHENFNKKILTVVLDKSRKLLNETLRTKCIKYKVTFCL